MRRITQTFMLLIALLSAFTLSGCGSSPASDTASTSPPAEQSGEVSPGDAALLYMEAMRGNAAGLKEYNPDSKLPEDGVFTNYHQGLLDVWEVKTTPEQDAQLTQAMLDGLSKVEFEVVDEKIDGNKATVTMSIRGLEMSKSLEKQMDAIGGQITDATEDAAIVDALDKTWREASLAKDPVEVDVQFQSVSDGRWIIDSSSGEDLFNAFLSYDD